MSSEQIAHTTEIKMGTERGFGFVFATVFAIISFWPVFFGNSLRVWALIIALLFAGIAIFHPSILRPLNVLWFKFGLLLGKFVTPIVMFLLFVTTFTPVALFLRASRKDNMALRIDRDVQSYWVNKKDIENYTPNMKNQF